ncbi:hypothetical protein CASFOL_026773 [Castilleja foliolosa]|uniref:Uncharacterized protein n=1 Tax=Castilleja foliolosa TaxID=1961234 RepID=A0ABD3CJP2_9LAMI
MGKVKPYNCSDDVINRDDEFDNILSILDFPMESLEVGDDDGSIGDWDPTKSQYLGPIPSDELFDTGPSVLQPKPVSHIDS